MIVHFMKSYRVMCNGARLKDGVLLSRMKHYRYVPSYMVDPTNFKAPQFAYTTSEAAITCPDCIQMRVKHFETMATMLRAKLAPLPPLTTEEAVCL